jgi:hypothetical protein
LAAWLRGTPLGRLAAGVALVVSVDAVAVPVAAFPTGPDVSRDGLAESVSAAFSAGRPKDAFELRVKSLDGSRVETLDNRHWICDAGQPLRALDDRVTGALVLQQRVALAQIIEQLVARFEIQLRVGLLHTAVDRLIEGVEQLRLRDVVGLDGVQLIGVDPERLPILLGRLVVLVVVDP